MKKVAVLVSTYNGEKYIEEQLDSIINQSYKNIDIYVRDDCSKDNTLAILKKLAKEKKIILMKSDKNLGYPEAFYEMLKKAKADYYAFSDQDDVWEKDKIEIAVNNLNKSNEKVPALFYANYEVTDVDLKHIRYSVGPNRKPDFRYSIFSSLGLGFTYVLNHSAKELVLNKRSVKNITKDVWIGMLISAFGDVYFSDKSCAKHRRNPGAYSSQDTTFISIQKDRVKKFLKNDGFNKVKSVICEFYDMFRDKLKEEDKKTIELFLFGNRLKKMFYPYRLRYDFKDELMLRIVFLLGRL